MKEKSAHLDPKVLTADGVGKALYHGQNSPCNVKHGIFETPSNEFNSIPTSVLVAHAKKLRLIREAKARAIRKAAEAKAAAKKARLDAIKAAKRAKADKMRKLLAKAKHGADALKAKKMKLRHKTIKQVEDACHSTFFNAAKNSYEKDYTKMLAKFKSHEKAKTRAGLHAIDHCKAMKNSLIKQVTKKLGAHLAKKIVDSQLRKVKGHYKKIVKVSRTIRKTKAKANSAKALVKKALKSKKAKKLLLVQENVRVQQQLNAQQKTDARTSSGSEASVQKAQNAIGAWMKNQQQLV